MLNLKEIAERIEQPLLCGKEDVADLQQLCVTYPYSQVFPLLYLKALAQNNDVRLDHEVEKYACFIADRSVLYHLLHTTQALQTAVPTSEVQEEVTIQQVVLETPTIQIEPTTEVVANDDVIEEEDHSINSEQSEVVEFVIASTEISDTKAIEDEAKLIVSTSANPETDEIHPLINSSQDNIDFESQLISQAIASTYSLEKEEVKFSLEQQLKKELPNIEIVTTEEIPSTNSLQDDHLVNSGRDIAIESKKSFSNWLNANRNYTVPETEKPDSNDLISKFITEKPSIKPNEKKFFEGRKENAEFFSPSKKAKQSLDEQQLPVSETLAKIFAAQGNFSKAIYAYQQLMLIIPEKKIFFAVQIEELEKKLNK